MGVCIRGDSTNHMYITLSIQTPIWTYSVHHQYKIPYILVQFIINAQSHIHMSVHQQYKCPYTLEKYIINTKFDILSWNSISVESAIWPSLSPCTIINPILLTSMSIYTCTVHHQYRVPYTRQYITNTNAHIHMYCASSMQMPLYPSWHYMGGIGYMPIAVICGRSLASCVGNSDVALCYHEIYNNVLKEEALKL